MDTRCEQRMRASAWSVLYTRVESTFIIRSIDRSLQVLLRLHERQARIRLARGKIPERDQSLYV